MKTATNEPQIPAEETRSISRLLVIDGVTLLIPIGVYSLTWLSGGLQAPGPKWTLALPFAAALLTLAVGARHLSRQHYTRAIRCLGLSVVQAVAALTLFILIGWALR